MLWADAKDVQPIWHLDAFELEMRSSRTPEAHERLKAELAGLIDRIEAEREFSPCESALCDWYPYWMLVPGEKAPGGSRSS